MRQLVVQGTPQMAGGFYGRTFLAVFCFGYELSSFLVPLQPHDLMR